VMLQTWPVRAFGYRTAIGASALGKLMVNVWEPPNHPTITRLSNQSLPHDADYTKVSQSLVNIMGFLKKKKRKEKQMIPHRPDAEPHPSSSSHVGPS
jgi:hypothetical protein